MKTFLTKNTFAFLSLLLYSVTSLTSAYPGSTSITPNEDKNTASSIRKNLSDEFQGAYLGEIERTGKVVEIDLVASVGEIEIIEGYKTQVWNYNGTVPGPEIRVKLGDTLKITMINQLPSATTIHWHGVRLPNSMDGVPGLTQEAVPPGKSFTYQFTPKDSGTFWFHPHVRGSEQVERGLFGVLIVEEKESPKYSKDVVWVIDDWRIREDGQIDPNFVTPSDLMHDGRWGNVITVNASRKERLTVQPGERIRLRLVNPSNGRIYAPDFGSLNATIIAVDGMYVKKAFDANGFALAPGNRIDVDLTIPQESKGKNYPVFDRFTRNANFLASIVVRGEKVETPGFDYPRNPKIPDWIEASEITTQKTYRLNVREKIDFVTIRRGLEWTINEKAYPNYDPVELTYNEFNKISFVNESSRLHPMHLHGQFFKVLSRNGKPVEEPAFRDTALIYPRETVTIGLVPLDRGEWLEHCHTLEHADAGMITVVSVK